MTLDEPTASLVAKAQGGDRAAFEILAGRYSSRLANQIRSRLGERIGSKVEVDDILQETFLRALGVIASFRWQGEESCYCWLASIAEHLIWTASQKKAMGMLRLTGDFPAADSTPSRSLRRSERFDRLEDAINELTPDQRQALKLARLDGLKVRDVAARMKRSEKAVYALLSRALEQLKKSFGDTESLGLPNRPLQIKDGGDAHKK